MISLINSSADSAFSLAALESGLVAYVKDEAAAEKPFDFGTVPKISREQAAKESARKSSGHHDQPLLNCM